MFNATPSVSRVELAPGSRVTVIDDVLSDPHALVDLAVRHRTAFTRATTNAFPGLELPLPQTVLDRFAEHFSQHARAAIGARRVLSASGRLSLVTLPPAALGALQRVCHRDRLAARADQCVGAAVVYLFRDEQLGGTSFFRSRHDVAATETLIRRWSTTDAQTFTAETGWPAGYMLSSNQHFEHVARIDARWNRMVCYDGSLFHGSHIERPELLSDDPSRGRLTLNLFYVCRRSAA
ncbi:MAG: DUF6445 family protein [Aquincola sp.]|nr:DUF6445 family protein [Aquincola sp.]MDH5329949.1 DUF6445 family protein [Aquincola sp.]